MKQVKTDITVEEYIEDFVDRKEYGTIYHTQPHMIDASMKYLHLLGLNIKTNNPPSCSSRILHRHSASEPFKISFNHRSVIGNNELPRRRES